MITGYNTDVEFGGVVYHVQTEDKGLDTPIILSLVYSGGAILASKRSPYDDLVARGFDEDLLAARLQRQHKLICAAVHAGRIDELKKLAGRESPPAAVRVEEQAAVAVDQAREEVIETEPAVVIEPEPAVVIEPEPAVVIETEPAVVIEPEPAVVIEPAAAPERLGDRFSIADEGAGETGLTVMLSGRQELRGGRSVTLRLNVMRRGLNGKERVPGARVTVKTLGTNFPPQSTFATTDDRGAVVVLVSLPDFKTGRAAILIRAEANGEVAELRKIILPSKT